MSAQARLPQVHATTRVLHALVRLLILVAYRMRRRNLDAVPRRGGVLLVCNHISFVDPLIIAAAFDRPVRFVMDHRIYKVRVINWIFRIAGVIPIAPRREDPELFASAFPRVEAALEGGELVCIFPEGKITYDGRLNDFRPGVDRIVEQTSVPVVPMALRGLWGSFFSRKGGAAMSSFPRRFWSKIELRCGAPLPAPQVDSQRLHAEVQRLLA